MSVAIRFLFLVTSLVTTASIPNNLSPPTEPDHSTHTLEARRSPFMIGSSYWELEYPVSEHIGTPQQLRDPTKLGVFDFISSASGVLPPSIPLGRVTNKKLPSTRKSGFTYFAKSKSYTVRLPSGEVICIKMDAYWEEYIVEKQGDTTVGKMTMKVYVRVKWGAYDKTALFLGFFDRLPDYEKSEVWRVVDEDPAEQALKAPPLDTQLSQWQNLLAFPSGQAVQHNS